MIHRYINNDGVNFIKHFEGYKSTAYECAAGYKTIGYGHLIKKNESYDFLNLEEAEILLRKDIFISETAVLKYIRGDINDNQFSALVSFTYNLGACVLQRSTLRQKINYGSSIDEIAEEFMRWIFSGGRKIQGLFIRRHAESMIYRSVVF